jgi:predicted RND superfamily exporter protein
MKFTRRREATIAVVFSAIIAVVGLLISSHLKVGDLDPGEPVLRKNSRYNQDDAYISQNYGTASDQFIVIGKVPAGDCFTYPALVESDRLGQWLREVPGVNGVSSAAEYIRFYTAGLFEGNPKWIGIPRAPGNASQAMNEVRAAHPEVSEYNCELMPVIASLTDHRAETLERVVQAAESFAKAHNTGDREFLLAGGNAGVEAATNIVVKQSNRTMLILLYLSVIVLCWITFRSWRAVIIAVVPLMITSILCEALMVMLGIGVKVATLPVVALGVGAGVDYALYLITVQLAAQRSGRSLEEAYREALDFTGRVVGLIGVTLAVGVVVWVWSPIKFQADMGILLTFMFLWNMIGALVLIPALSHFLLADGTVARTSTVTAPRESLPARASAVRQETAPQRTSSLRRNFR